MTVKLIIVESPNKIKKIQQFLGPSWLVAASVGHIRDLPNKEMGVSPPSFKPLYITNPDKKKVVSNLKALAKKADIVYLATDPDREGESIAWHIQQVLKLSAAKRITFTEITKSAINKAIENPRDINYDLVTAQEARRVLDRLVGYTISPILSNKSGLKLSAGRVQSPTVKIVVLREREIINFTPIDYFTVKAELDNGLIATLDTKEWSGDSKYLTDKSIAKIISETTQVKITGITTETTEIKPRPPFTTSTLTQAASVLYKLSAKEIMGIAQSLFEQGAISYHRTDSQNLSSDSFNEMRSFLNEQNQPTQEKQIKWPEKDLAQEGHEAIRPTNTHTLQAGITSNEQKLYSLIRERALTSVMNPATEEITTVEVISNQNIEIDGLPIAPAKFKATGRIELQAGWRLLCEIESKKESPGTLSDNVKENKIYTASCNLISKKTQAPPRFTEATLIAALEKLGIGRPSTYASILENIKKKNYIEIESEAGKKKGIKLKPTNIGFHIADSLEPMSFMNLNFTRLLEEQLDKISTGVEDYIKTVSFVFDELSKQASLLNIDFIVETVPCQMCNKPLKLIPKKGKRAAFWVHTEETDSCEKFINDEKGVPSKEKKKEKTLAACPQCSNQIEQKYSSVKKFYFWVHTEREHGCTNFIKDNEVVDRKI